METEAADVALAVAAAAPVIAAEPLTEMMALVSDCFRHLTRRRISWSDQRRPYDAARVRIEHLAKQNGLKQLVILAEPDAPPATAGSRADGGVTLDHHHRHEDQ